MKSPKPNRAAESTSGRLVAGLQPVREALRVHGPAVHRVALDERRPPRLEALARFARDRGVSEVEWLAGRVLDRLSRGVSHQGALAWAPPLGLLPLSALLDDPALIALGVDQIQDPQNFGALLRSAVGLASAAVIWPEHASAPLTPATFRASAGGIEHARLCRVASLHGALAELAAHGAQVVGLDAQASTLLAQLDLRGPTVLVVGSEHEGLSRPVRRACTQMARLVQPARIDSLNASVACGIALYEAAIQRMNPERCLDLTQAKAEPSPNG
jgi:23S rRNA (guanosine2251-2'-O)-methyltransferase